MAETPDPHQRTEEPTPKRLEDARKKGDAPKSPEIVAAAMIAAAGLCLLLLMKPAALALAGVGEAFLERPHEFAADGDSLAQLFLTASAKAAIALGLAAALLVAVALAANFAQAAPVLSPDRLKPSWSRLSPAQGAKRIFGPTGLVNFGKGIAKLVVVGAILLYALWPDRDRLAALPYTDERAILSLAGAEAAKLAAIAVVAMTAIAGLDYAWARREWKQRLRMTKEEVRRELKESEGDPQIKGRQRQQREARARRRMMTAVRDATVLIMNPTHYAVALKYQADEGAAPRCVAKGLDDLALRLRTAAEEARVPIVDNPPLARALYAAVDIDDEIPVEHYEAVAKVIGFVMGKAKPRRAS